MLFYLADLQARQPDNCVTHQLTTNITEVTTQPYIYFSDGVLVYQIILTQRPQKQNGRSTK